MVFSSKESRNPIERNHWLLAAVMAVCGFANSLHAQQDGFKDLFDGALNPKRGAKAEFNATLTPSDAQAGDEVVLTLTAQLPPDTYLYATTGEFEGRTRITSNADIVGLDGVDQEFQPDPGSGINGRSGPKPAGL